VRTSTKPTRKAEVGRIPAGYGELLDDLKTRIRASKLKASRAVNREVMTLHWHIGRSIVDRQKTDGWGEADVERLVADLGRQYPGAAMFSRSNILLMREFYLAWSEEILSRFATELEEQAVLPRPVAELPWEHNIILVNKIKAPGVRIWYAQQAVGNGWARSTLEHWIESDLHGQWAAGEKTMSKSIGKSRRGPGKSQPRR